MATVCLWGVRGGNRRAAARIFVFFIVRNVMEMLSEHASPYPINQQPSFRNRAADSVIASHRISAYFSRQFWCYEVKVL